ncbi:chalcone isomerase-like protein 1 [Mercurialis annua]|uniref:chalcone isomerase-like protein 1 n=1 Tax=Mercurialis annua TaxID=3986 RepID=UPI00216098AE|nr:chalcone isomerase-like protein 1 [Mercurialis annua]
MATLSPEAVVAKDQTSVEEKANGNGVEHKVSNGMNGENGANGVARDDEPAKENGENEEMMKMVGKEEDVQKKEEEVGVEVEAKSGVAFPVKLADGKHLISVGLRKKSMLGMGIKIYAFGMYTDNEKLKAVMKSKIGKAPAKATKEMYEAVIDSDLEMMVRLVIVFSNLTMNMVKRNFDEGLGAAIKKLNGGKKNDDLSNKVMGEASDNIKLTSGSVIEISHLPGYVLETKVKGEVVSKVESELLCRAYLHMYLGDDPFDKDAKEKFGMSLLSLF